MLDLGGGRLCLSRGLGAMLTSGLTDNFKGSRADRAPFEDWVMWPEVRRLCNLDILMMKLKQGLLCDMKVSCIVNVDSVVCCVVMCLLRPIP